MSLTVHRALPPLAWRVDDESSQAARREQSLEPGTPRGSAVIWTASEPASALVFELGQDLGSRIEYQCAIQPIHQKIYVMARK